MPSKFQVVMLICAFQFFWFSKPSEPFMGKYMKDYMHFDDHTVDDDVYPIWTYAYFGGTILVGLVAESIGYRLVCSAGTAMMVTAAFLMVESPDLKQIQITQAVSGLGFATQLVFSSLVFRIVRDPRLFQLTTGWTRGFALGGLCVSSLLGQLLLAHTSLTKLFYASAALTSVAFAISLAFPRPQLVDTPLPERTFKQRMQWYRQLGSQVWETFDNVRVLRWTVWISMSLAIHQLFLIYWQTLFHHISSTHNYNGYVFAGAFFVGVIVTQLPTKGESRLVRNEVAVQVGVALLCALLLFGIAKSHHISAAYILFIAYHSLFEVMFVLSTAQLGMEVAAQRYAAVFAVTYFAAMAIQAAAQVIMGARMLNLGVRDRFVFFSIMMVVMVLMLAAIALWQRWHGHSVTRTSATATSIFFAECESSDDSPTRPADESAMPRHRSSLDAPLIVNKG